MNDYWTLDESYLAGRWIAHVADVNLDDLVNSKPGSIIRVRSHDALKYIPPSMDDYERIAGMISDGA